MVTADDGPTVILRSRPGRPSGSLHRRASGALRYLDGEIASIIGGFAVMVRLATAHRVTENLDTVTRTEDGAPRSPDCDAG